MSRFTRFSLLALLIVLIVPAGFAQVSNTTGALIGHVTDQAGAVLPGVTVTVTGTTLQGSRTAVTDATGEYVLPLLPPGTYHAEFALSGIKSQVRDNVTVSLGQKTEINVQMQLAVTETVTVTASQVVIDPTQTTQQTNLKEDHLKYTAVGSANRTYQGVLQQAAGVAGGSNPQVAGANSAQNTWMLDGINTTDPVTHTFGGNLSFDAIQEISITTLGKDAEFGSSGGTVNVITKSGGNNFSGVADYRYNDKKLQSQGQEKKFVAPTVFGGPVGASSLRFDKNIQPAKSVQPALSVGGPIQRDRLWFFASIQHPDTSTTPPNTNNLSPAPGLRAFTGWNNIGKLTFTPVSNQTVTAKFLDTYALVTHIANNSSTSAVADRNQTQGSRTMGLGYDAILSSKWLFNAQVGHTPGRLAAFPSSGDFTTPGVQNLATGIASVNATNFQARTSKRDELLLNTTYYLERFGTHAFKVGFDGNKTAFTSFNNAVGNPTLLDGFPTNFCSSANGFPSGANCVGFVQVAPGGIANVPGLGIVTERVVASVQNPAHTVDSKSFAYFAQDEWNPMTRLTVRYGVRYEQVKWNNNSVAEPPDFKLFQPRLGAAYDIFNNANSVVHGYAGKIMDDNQLTLPNFGFQQPQGTILFNQKPGTTNQWVLGANTLSLSGGVYDPNLKPSYSNQYSVGYTQKIWRNTSIDFTYEKRNQKNLYEDYDGYIDYTDPLKPVVINEPFTITNHPGADRGAKNVLRSDYQGLIAKIESRPYQWLDILTSWTHAKSRGSTESTQNQDTSFDYFPTSFINRYGFLSDDAKNRVKLDGYVHLPLDFTVGTNFYWDDGLPYTVFQTANVTVPPISIPDGNYFIEPRGSRRLPHFTQTDVQIQKDFRLGSSKIGLIFSVLNLLNAETITGVNGNAGSRAIADANGKLFIDPNQATGANRLSATFQQPTAFQRPRRYEVGIRFEY
jgi:hypothetical protein